ncbi:MAG: secretion protein HlyD, partial [Bosea sp. 32-68-6]
RNDNVVSVREIERLENLVEGRQAGVAAATAARETAQTRISVQLPAARASAEAALAQAQVELDKTVIRAGVAGHIEQFALRVGDIVNPLLRPAGILIPVDAGRRTIQAAFTQIEAPSLKVGMIGEISCMSKPWTIIPVVVTDVQDFIATGQFRASDQLVDLQQSARVGSVLVFMEPLYEGGFDGLIPGTNCSANAYTSHHDAIASGKHSAFRNFVMHAIDVTGVVHAAVLRIQAALAPIKVLVLSGH